MDIWIERLIPIGITAIVTFAGTMFWKGFRADLGKDIEEKQEKRHAENTEKLESLHTILSELMAVVAKQTVEISGLREIQVQHDRSQRDGLEAQRRAIESLEERVLELERFVRGQVPPLPRRRTT